LTSCSAAAPPEVIGDYIATHVVRAERASRAEEGAWFATGAPHEELNGVLRLGGSEASTAGVARLRARFDGMPALWHSWPGVTDRTETVLLASGFEFVEEEPVMTADSDALASAQNVRATNVTVRTAESAKELGDWAVVWCGAPSNEIPVDLLRALSLGLENGSVRYLVGYDGSGAAVGCAAAVVAGRTAAIEHVVTRRDARGRGVGTAMTARAMVEASAQGATHAILTASADGIRIYGRLGFRQVGLVRRFRDTVGA
jgi:ribosomal protein S18 acetylase RimI-like enzyme